MFGHLCFAFLVEECVNVAHAVGRVVWLVEDAQSDVTRALRSIEKVAAVLLNKA